MLVLTCAWAEFSALQLGKGLGPPLKCGEGEQGVRVAGKQAGRGISRGLMPNLLLKTGSAMGSDRIAQGFIHLGLAKLQGWRML